MVKGCIHCWLTRIRSADLPRLAVIVAGKFEERDQLRLPGNSERISQATPPPAHCLGRQGCRKSPPSSYSTADPLFSILPPWPGPPQLAAVLEVMRLQKNRSGGLPNTGSAVMKAREHWGGF